MTSLTPTPTVEDQTMKHLTSLPLMIAPLFANEAFAFDNPPLEKDTQLCYGYAMVGYDSVINSRLDVPVEYALGLAMKIPVTAAADEQYSIDVLKVVLDAYLWPDSPHDYAVQVFYHCTKDQGSYLGASLEDA